MKRTILVVDDEKNVRDITRAYLEKAGYDVLEAADGEAALEAFQNLKVDLMILDIMMPKLNGMEVLECIRRSSDVPVIMLTAKVGESDLVEGIQTGADDYIKKPFSMRELMVRVEALMRRIYKGDKQLILEFGNGDLMVDLPKMKVMKKKRAVDLTPNEFKILKVLVENSEIVLSREQLIERAFGISFDGFDRTVDTHIKNLRHKLEDNPKKPVYIRTVYGMGYQFLEGGGHV